MSHPQCKCSIDLIPRKRYPGKIYDWKPIHAVFHQEQPMHYREDPANFEIREVSDMLYGRRLHIEVNGIESLPSTLRRLASMGYDLDASLAALQKAVEEQSKRKALDDAVKAMAKPAETDR